jgi:tRNA (guanosine-2'-O-)-methyltransferase
MNAEDRAALVRHLLQFVTPARRQRMETVLPLRTSHLQVVLEDIFQPHNASAVMRSCECFGIQHLHIIENHHPYALNREVAMGSSNWLHLHRYRDHGTANSSDCLRQLRRSGLRIVATSLAQNAIPLEELELDTPLSLWFGTEESGLSPEVLEAADTHVHIPMYGFTQSLNLSVCAALCLHDIRRRLMNDPVSWQLTDSEKEDVMLLWLRHSVRNAAILERDFLARRPPGNPSGP